MAVSSSDSACVAAPRAASRHATKRRCRAGARGCALAVMLVFRRQIGEAARSGHYHWRTSAGTPSSICGPGAQAGPASCSPQRARRLKSRLTRIWGSALSAGAGFELGQVLVITPATCSTADTSSSISVVELCRAQPHPRVKPRAPTVTDTVWRPVRPAECGGAAPVKNGSLGQWSSPLPYKRKNSNF
eukprot:360089-Chlamydomonas_euryale.AAC.1